MILVKSKASCIDARRRLMGATESCATGPAVPPLATALPPPPPLGATAEDAECVASSLSISCDDDLLELASPTRHAQKCQRANLIFIFIHQQLVETMECNVQSNAIHFLTKLNEFNSLNSKFIKHDSSKADY